MNYNRIYLILATIIIINLYLGFLPQIAHLILGGTLLILASFAYGAKKYKDAPLIQQFFLGLFFILLVSAFIGAVSFYFFSLGKWLVIALLIIIFLKTKSPKFTIIKPQFKNYALIAYFILAGFLIYLLATNGTSELIKSPWLELPRYFLPIFLLSTIVLIVALYRKKGASQILALSLHFFIFFSIGAFIYKLGYGFDQFVHEATQKYILDNGTITPKPLQYIGLYGINIFLHYLLSVPISFLNKFLLPALSALIVPIGYYFLSSFTKNKIAFLGILLLPLSFLIVTTPQGVANLFLLFYIFLTFKGYKKIWPAFACFFIHPISGIVAFIYIALLRIKTRKKILVLLSILALPLAFLLLSYKTSGTINLHFNFIETIKNYFDLLFSGGLKKNFAFPFDLIYLMQYALLPFVFILSFWFARKNKNRILQTPLHIFGILTASFLLTGIFIDFSYLIDYERQNYSMRIFYISFLFLTPYFILALSSFKPFKKGVSEGLPLKIFFICLFSFFITSNLYLSYPRYDDYENDKGKNITSWMIKAVNKIDQDAKGANYAVLTDQALSAAALKENGFKKYYITPLGEVFYYPIPTSGPLYNEFLNLIYNDAGVLSVRNARFLTKARQCYVALPKYWENFEKIREKLKSDMEVLYEDKKIVILRD